MVQYKVLYGKTNFDINETKMLIFGSNSSIKIYHFYNFKMCFVGLYLLNNQGVYQTLITFRIMDTAFFSSFLD